MYTVKYLINQWVFFSSSAEKAREVVIGSDTCMINFRLDLHPCRLLLISGQLRFYFNLRKKIRKYFG